MLAVLFSQEGYIRRKKGAKMKLGLLFLLGGLIQKPQPVDYVLLSVTETAILLDLSQTLDIKNHLDLQESNPLMGRHPSDPRILLGGGAIMLGVGGAWLFLSNEWRRLFLVAILVLEVHSIFLNHDEGLTFKVPW